MLELILETLSWGMTTALMSTIFCVMFEVKGKNIKNIILISTIYGLKLNALEEGNNVAIFFMERFGVVNGIVFRELLLTLPLVLASYYLLKYMALEQPKHIQSLIVTLPFYIIGAVHLIATMNNLMLIGSLVIESAPYPKISFC